MKNSRNEPDCQRRVQPPEVGIAILTALIAPQDARAPMTSIPILSKRMSQDEDQRILDQLESGN
jgi:hypothetical protein